MNVSNDTSNSQSMWLTNAQITVFTILYSITVTLALIGNLLVIYIVMTRPEARKLTSFLFVNMAAADLLVTLIVMPVSMAIPYTNMKWLPGNVGHATCKIVYFSFHVSIAASILTLVFLAVDRFLAVLFPFQRFPTFRNAKVLTSAIWLISLVTMMPVTVLWRIEKGLPEGMYCQQDFTFFGDFKKGATGFYTYLFLITYLVPLLAISVLYLLVSHELWFYSFPGEDLISSGIDKKRRKATKKIVRTLLIITVAFALCWLPAQSYHLIFAFNMELHFTLPQYVIYVCLWLGHANCAFNPWLYMLMSNQFRKPLRDMMSRKSKSTHFMVRETYV